MADTGTTTNNNDLLLSSKQKITGILDYISDNNGVTISATQPEDETIAKLWVDTAETNADDVTKGYLVASIANLLSRIETLEYAFSHDISFGDFTNNYESNIEESESDVDSRLNIIDVEQEPLTNIEIKQNDWIVPTLADGTTPDTSGLITHIYRTEATQEFDVESINSTYNKHVDTTVTTKYKPGTDITDPKNSDVHSKSAIQTISINYLDPNDAAVLAVTTTNTESSYENVQGESYFNNSYGGHLATLHSGSVTETRNTNTSVVQSGETISTSSDTYKVNSYQTVSSSGVNTIKTTVDTSIISSDSVKIVTTTNTSHYEDDTGKTIIGVTIEDDYKLVENIVEITTNVSTGPYNSTTGTYSVISSDTLRVERTRITEHSVTPSETYGELINDTVSESYAKFNLTDQYTQWYLSLRGSIETNGVINVKAPAYIALTAEQKADYAEIKKNHTPIELSPITTTTDHGSINKYTPNARHLRIKSGSSIALKKIINSKKIPFLSGELLYCYDTNELHICTPYGTVKPVSTSGGGSAGNSSSSSVSSGGMNLTVPISSEVEKVKYTVTVNQEGNLVHYPTKNDDSILAPETPEVTAAAGEVKPVGSLYMQGLYINSFYCGGDTKTELDYNCCDYNFVELSYMLPQAKYRYSSYLKELPLNGLALYYSGTSGDKWNVLPLKGVIKEGSTFLIRGAKCSVSEANTTVIDVGEPDMEWYVTKTNSNGISYKELIKFSNITCKFFLSYDYNATDPQSGGEGNDCGVVTPWYSASKVKYGYIDLVGMQASTDNKVDAYETTAFTGLNSNRIFTKYFTLDGVKQAQSNKDTIDKRKNNADWYYVDLASANKETGINKHGINVLNYTPKNSKEHKDIFYNKSKINKTKPNMVTCSFGINATDPSTYTVDSTTFGSDTFTYAVRSPYNTTGSNILCYIESEKPNCKILKSDKSSIVTASASISELDYGATRCFNWVSYNYYNEYLWYRRKTTTKISDGSVTTHNDPWIKIESFDEAKISERLPRYQYACYNRVRTLTTDNTPITTHKVVLPHLVCVPGTYTVYEYYCGRENFTPGADGIYNFTIRNTADVSNFSVIQVTDQQGFNGDEYIPWGKSADFIESKESKGAVLSANDASYSDSSHPEIQGFDFIINTGDMTQNGNRVNEWLDYYKGSLALAKKYEQMYVIGNNDLCPKSYQGTAGRGDGADLSKINDVNFKIFYTYEQNVNNLTSVGNNAGDFINSIYSFNYGNTHFLALNSELTTYACDQIFGDKASGANLVYGKIESFIQKDFNSMPSNIKWKVAYMHEQPFTLVTDGQIGDCSGKDYIATSSEIREGSHMNTVYTNYSTAKKFWLSRILEIYGYQLSFCGHKHTYTCTNRLRENYRFIWNNRNITVTPPSTDSSLRDLKSFEQSKLDVTSYKFYCNTAKGTNISVGNVFTGAQIKEFLANGNVTQSDLDNGMFNILYDSADEYPRRYVGGTATTSGDESTTSTASPDIIYNNIRLVEISSMIPVAQCLNINNGGTVTNTDYSNVTSRAGKHSGVTLVHPEKVSKYNAPIYVMCQATGHKQLSNKEVPANNIPWVTNYFSSSDGRKNQKYPFYIKWNIAPSYIRGDVFRIFSIDDGASFKIYGDPYTTAPYRQLGNGDNATSQNVIIIDDNNTEIRADIKAS